MRLPYRLLHVGIMRRDKYYFSEIYHFLFSINPKIAWKFERYVLNPLYYPKNKGI